MPLVAHNGLPSFSRLKQEGLSVLPANRAVQQDIRELHVGLCNMMPDAALEATERQFFRLVGQSNPIAQFYVHPFTIDALPRGESAKKHIFNFYEPFSKIREDGLDALIITGANVTCQNLSQEPFWDPLIEVIQWARQNVTSTLCSCLATHAVLQFFYDQCRIPMQKKRWGVYSHRVLDKRHPLVKDINTRFDVPHSRWNDISRKQFETAGLHILAESEEVGVHLAVSPDRLNMVFFQGHPEYDTISLLKEYKRDVMLYSSGKRDEYPLFPEHYFKLKECAILEEYRDRLISTKNAGDPIPPFPVHWVDHRLDNTWHDTAEAVVGNWMGCIYQVTHSDRRHPFMEDVDPKDPLGLVRAEREIIGD
ncbi:Homoserine O-succinyltransferase [Gammaproteobacteria bacterium]